MLAMFPKLYFVHKPSYIQLAQLGDGLHFKYSIAEVCGSSQRITRNVATPQRIAYLKCVTSVSISTTKVVTQRHLSKNVQCLPLRNTVDSSCSELYSLVIIEYSMQKKQYRVVHQFSSVQMQCSIFVTGECSSKQLASTVFVDHKLCNFSIDVTR